jgi:hypothetical protein
MTASVMAIAGLLLGYAAGKLFIPGMMRAVTGAPILEDIPASWSLINTALVWGFAIVVATIGYQAVKRV